jgi:autotransporter-associated beta strand protein
MKSIKHALALSLTVFALSQLAQSQTIYDWYDTAPDANWKQGASGARWTGGLWDQPGFGVLRFNNNHQLNMSNNVSGTYSMHGIIFGSSNTSVRTLGGNAMRLFDFGTANPYIQNESTATHIINFALEGDGDSADPLEIRINNNGGGGLTFGGTINNQGSTINVGGTASSAAIVSLNDVVSGSGGLYLNNANLTVSLGAAHTFSGQTTIDAGTLRLASGGSLANSEVRLAAATLLQVNANAQVASVAEKGTSNSGTISLGSGATLTINGANKGTLFQNSIGGAGNLNMAGSGTTSLSLFGTQSYTGSTTVSGGKISTGVSLSTTQLDINGGTFETSAANILADTTPVSLTSGSYTLGGNDTIGQLSGTGGTVALGSSKLTMGGTNASTDFSGSFTGTGGQLEKVGNGTMTLSGTGGHTGVTTVSNGTLLVNGSLVGTATIGANGTLGGTGTISGAVNVTGVLAPGASIQSLGTGAVSFTNGSTFAYELNSASLNGDLVDSTGTLDIASGSILTLTQLASGTLTNGSKLTLISYFGGWTSGELFSYNAGAGLATLADDSTITLGSNQWLFNYNDNSGGSNFSTDQSGATSFVTMTVVPEPAAAALGLLGTVLLLRRRRA